MLDAQLREYRKHRAMNVPAITAYRWCSTPDPRLSISGLTWEGLNREGLPVADGIVNGYQVHVEIRWDSYAEPDGSWSDQWALGAVQSPEWRPGNYLHRWYHPLNPAENARDYYHKAGRSRHDAWLTAQRQVLEDLVNDRDGSCYCVTATVHLHGVNLSESSLNGICVGPDSDDEDYLLGVAVEVIRDALSEAEDALKRLLSNLVPSAAPDKEE
jgi:hypothetical protein